MSLCLSLSRMISSRASKVLLEVIETELRQLRHFVRKISKTETGSSGSTLVPPVRLGFTTLFPERSSLSSKTDRARSKSVHHCSRGGSASRRGWEFWRMNGAGPPES
jgi:hypothetical protein